jgi:hypothetical protein
LILTIKMFATAFVTCTAAYIMKMFMGCDKVITFIIQFVVCGVIYIGLSFITGQLRDVFQISVNKKK